MDDWRRLFSLSLSLVFITFYLSTTFQGWEGMTHCAEDTIIAGMLFLYNRYIKWECIFVFTFIYFNRNSRYGTRALVLPSDLRSFLIPFFFNDDEKRERERERERGGATMRDAKRYFKCWEKKVYDDDEKNHKYIIILHYRWLIHTRAEEREDIEKVPAGHQVFCTILICASYLF